jgi:membrane fusion protein (multidrug efflux system)
VWLLDEAGSTRFQPVQAGAWFGDQWFIDEGLHGGETVIVDGALKVRAGIKVQATPHTDIPVSQ